MNEIGPINQTKLFGLNNFLIELVDLFEKNKLPNKILLSGQKGLGKSTMAYHFINYVLSKNEKFEYNINNFEINSENSSFKTIINKSNPNLILIDVNLEKKKIDINQVRDLIKNLNKSSFNQKPRFVLIDNIEFLNVNSVNALLKVIEEPNYNVNFILINNNKKILPTLLSRCINFKIFLSHQESLEVIEKLLNCKLNEKINNELITYYFTPGNIFNLIKLSNTNEYDLVNLNLKEFLMIIIKNNHYKKNDFFKYMFFDFVEFYFSKINASFNFNVNKKYSYFLKRISDTKRFNLDEESLIIEIEDKLLNG